MTCHGAGTLIFIKDFCRCAKCLFKLNGTVQGCRSPQGKHVKHFFRDGEPPGATYLLLDNRIREYWLQCFRATWLHVCGIKRWGWRNSHVSNDIIPLFGNIFLLQKKLSLFHVLSPFFWYVSRKPAIFPGMNRHEKKNHL